MRQLEIKELMDYIKGNYALYSILCLKFRCNIVANALEGKMINENT